MRTEDGDWVLVSLVTHDWTSACETAERRTWLQADLRGTAYGFFNLMSGLAMLLASVVAGVLWQSLGAATTFWAGAAFSGLAMVGLLVRGELAAAR